MDDDLNVGDSIKNFIITIIRKNLVHSNHMIMTINATSVQINFFNEYS